MVLLRSTGLRVYWQPSFSDAYRDFPGNLWPAGLAIADLGFNLKVTPQTLSFQGGQGDTLPWQYVSIENVGSGQTNWSASSATPWIQLSATSGVTPASLGINVNTSSLTPGTYQGTVSIGGQTGVSQQTVTVNLTIVNPKLAVTPTSLNMSFTAGQFLEKRTQALQLFNSASSLTIPAMVGLSGQINTSTGQQWLFVDRSTGSTPFPVNVTVDPQAAGVGIRTGTVLITRITPPMAQ